MEFENEKGKAVKYFIENMMIPSMSETGVGLTLDWAGSCDLKCEYCYWPKYKHEYFQGKPFDRNACIENSLNIVEYFLINAVPIKALEIFSGGSPLVDKLYCEFLEKLYPLIEKYKNSSKINTIGMPSNFGFIKKEYNSSKETLEQFTKLIKKYDDIDIYIGFSASVDGPFTDRTQRKSVVNNDCYTDEFYNDLAKLKKSGFHMGFHPMTYSKTIDHSIDNMLYMDKHMGAHYNLMVRNHNWTPAQCESLYWSKRFMTNYIIRKNQGKKGFRDILLKYNIKQAGCVGRGYTCSIQTDLEFQTHVPGKLILVPCHRTSYKELLAAEVKLSNDNNSWHFKGLNVEFYIMMQTGFSRTGYPCTRCPVNMLCDGGCPGANYEATGSVGVQMPTTCTAIMCDIKGEIDAMYDTGVHPYIPRTAPEYYKNKGNVTGAYIKKGIQIEALHRAPIEEVIGGRSWIQTKNNS